MRKFLFGVLWALVALAALGLLLWIVPRLRQDQKILEDRTGKIIDDGLSHILGSVELPQQIFPEAEDEPEDLPEVPDETEKPDGSDASDGLLWNGEDFPLWIQKPQRPVKPEEEEPITLIAGGVPESAPVEDSYFDDVVFIGDSVSLKLQYYVREKRSSEPDFLGGAQFLTAGSFSYINALKPVTEESVHPTYHGEKMLLEDAVAACGAKKLYIMLGMNDIAGGRYEATIANLKTVMGRIREKAPDVTFYFQSVTPRTEDSEIGSLNNEIIRGYNEALLHFCEENGYYFIDVYSALCDEMGDLPPEYCSDPVATGGMGIHFTNAACKAWIDYLFTHTA